MRVFWMFTLLLAGCAVDRPRWMVRSADGIPRDAEIWVTPAGGDDVRATDAFDSRIISELVHDGARVRNDEPHPGEWRMDVVVQKVVTCDDGGWFPRQAAFAEARVTVFHDERVNDQFVVRGTIPCRGTGSEASRTYAGRQLAIAVADVMKARRHVW